MRRSVWRAVGLAVAWAVVLGVPSVCADDTVIGSVGGRWQALNSDDIRMVSETVRVRLGRERADVECEFVLRNGGASQRVKVGFPQKLGTAPLHNFRCWVDGHQVEVESQVDKVGPERIDGESARMHPYEGWHWWWMSFEPREVHKVRHTYEAEHSEDSMDGGAFLYVMQTGATWKGRIGDATVEVDLGPVASAGICRATPSGYQADGSRLTWRWQDFEPEDDIRVAWISDPKVVIEVPFAERNGKALRLDLPARECKRDGTIFAPVRWMADIAGAECRWDAATQSVALVPRSGREMRLAAGRASAESDWGPVPLGGTVYWLDDRVMAPIRPVAEWLGIQVRFGVGSYYWVRLNPP